MNNNPPARPQNACNLAQRSDRVVDRAEHHRRDDGVERVVGEGQGLSRRPVNSRRGADALCTPLELASHGSHRLGE